MHKGCRVSQFLIVNQEIYDIVRIMKKWFIRIVILLMIAMVGIYFVAKSYYTKDYVVEKLEKSINSRVQVGDINVSLFGAVELVDVIIHKRDQFADDKVPQSEREMLTDGSIKLGSVEFDLSFWEIVSRKLSIDSIDIDRVVAKLEVLEDGSLDVESYFDKPDRKKKKKRSFNARDHKKFITEIREVNLTNLNVDLILKKHQLLARLQNGEMRVSDIQVNPKKLETVNDAKIKIRSDLGLFSLNEEVEYGKLGLNGETNLTIFNVESGDLEPDMNINLVVSPDSYLTTKIPFINNVWDSVWKSFEVLHKAGMNKVRLPERAELRNNQKVNLTYKLGQIDLLDTFSVHISDWELQLVEGSEFNSVSDQHDAEMKLYVGNKLSKVISGLAGKSEKLGSLIGKLTGGKSSRSSNEGHWMEEGRVFLQVESSGDLSKPQLRVKNTILAPVQGGLENLLDKKNRDKLKQGADLLKGFLK